MAEEKDILKLLAENPSISQRKIAEKTGISLGQVNFLLKKCVKKGFIKIEGQTSKSLCYNITPRGIAQKASLTLEYVKVSYNAIITLSNNIKNLADQYQLNGYQVIVVGLKDEMMDICKLALGNRASYYNTLTDDRLSKDKYVIFYWDENILSMLDLRRIKAVNILL